MASPDIIKGVALQFLAPDKIGATENILKDMHTDACAENPTDALAVGQLLTEVRKLRAKLQAKSQTQQELAAALKAGLDAKPAKK